VTSDRPARFETPAKRPLAIWQRKAQLARRDSYWQSSPCHICGICGACARYDEAPALYRAKPAFCLPQTLDLSGGGRRSRLCTGDHGREPKDEANNKAENNFDGRHNFPYKILMSFERDPANGMFVTEFRFWILDLGSWILDLRSWI
jgi:hypothetical protein